MKIPPHRPEACLGEMLVGAPLDRLAIDIFGPFPQSTQGSKYVLAVTNYFVKRVEIFVVPDQRDVTCAEVIYEVIRHHSCPYYIQSDLGWNYESITFAELCHLLEI